MTGWTGRKVGEARAIPALLLAAGLAVAGCAPMPGADEAEKAIRAHFESRGYRVVELSLGGISRNPVAEREYMAPLTFVVEVPSLVLEARFPDAGGAGTGGEERLRFSGASVKIQALPQPRKGWVVSQAAGIVLR